MFVDLPLPYSHVGVKTHPKHTKSEKIFLTRSLLLSLASTPERNRTESGPCDWFKTSEPPRPSAIQRPRGGDTNTPRTRLRGTPVPIQHHITLKTQVTSGSGCPLKTTVPSDTHPFYRELATELSLLQTHSRRCFTTDLGPRRGPDSQMGSHVPCPHV